MAEITWWESFRVEHGRLPDQLTRLILSGDVRRVILRHPEGWAAAEFLIAGYSRLALEEIAGMAELLDFCTVSVERVDHQAARVARMITTAP